MADLHNREDVEDKHNFLISSSEEVIVVVVGNFCRSWPQFLLPHLRARYLNPTWPIDSCLLAHTDIRAHRYARMHTHPHACMYVCMYAHMLRH